jgi:carboxymethylenebutenolidase
MRKTLFAGVVAVLLCCASDVRAAAPADKAPSADTAKQQLETSPRHGEWVDITVPGSDTKLHTWVVYPERKDKAPVVVVISEIFGMTEWVRAVADGLAANGYIAVAPDLLSGKGKGGGGTESFDESGVRSAIMKLTDDEVTARLDAGREYAIGQPSATDKTACIGFCWGGGKSFMYATRQPKLNAAVVYYGTAPKSKDALSKIMCPVAGFYGGNDNRVTSTVEPTKAEMADLGKAYTPRVFEGAGHGFLRQQSGEANKTAADTAWADTLAFLKKNLDGEAK